MSRVKPTTEVTVREISIYIPRPVKTEYIQEILKVVQSSNQIDDKTAILVTEKLESKYKNKLKPKSED